MTINVPKELVDRFEENFETYQKNPMAIWADFLESDTMRRLTRNIAIECAKRRREQIFELIVEIDNEPGQKDESE